MIGVCLKLSANFRSVFLVRVAQRPDTSDSTEKKPAPPSGPFLIKFFLFLGWGDRERDQGDGEADRGIERGLRKAVSKINCYRWKCFFFLSPKFVRTLKLNHFLRSK